MIKIIKGTPPSLSVYDRDEDNLYIYLYKDNDLRCYYRRLGELTPYRLFYDLEYIVNRFTGYSVSSLKDASIRAKVVNRLGCSPSNHQKVIRGVIGELLIDDLQPYAGKLCLSKYNIKRKNCRAFNTVFRWDFNKLTKLKNSIDKVKQLDKDGLMHLAPFVAIENKTPSELKDILGKSCWRKICNNSFSRNKLLVDCIGNRWMCYGNSPYAEYIRFLVEIPSTILKYNDSLVRTRYGLYDAFLDVIKLRRAEGLFYKDIDRQHVSLYGDMLRMANQLGRKPNPKKWSDVVKLHDRYAEEQLDKEMENISDDPITNVIIPSFTIGNYLCTPLVSVRDLYKEGKLMHHCIYSYVDSVINCCFYVIRIENTKTNEISTLGLAINTYVYLKSPVITIHQHCGRCNSPTKNTEVEIEVRDYIIKEISRITNVEYNSIQTDNKVRQTC